MTTMQTAAMATAATPPNATETKAAPVQLSVAVWDVLKLTQSKIADDTLIAFVNNSTAAYNLGADRNRLVVKVAGGSQLLDAQGIFNIGIRNIESFKKLLAQQGLNIHANDTGGMASRTSAPSFSLSTKIENFWTLSISVVLNDV